AKVRWRRVRPWCSQDRAAPAARPDGHPFAALRRTPAVPALRVLSRLSMRIQGEIIRILRDDPQGDGERQVRNTGGQLRLPGRNEPVRLDDWGALLRQGAAGAGAARSRGDSLLQWCR